MIYLTEGNIPLNAAYDDNIVQEANSTYQLTFKFPTNNILWQRLREETFLTADDLHGEQDFVIFEVEKKHGYIQVYANQVFTLLNNYVVNPISLDRQTGSTALSRFAGSITRSNQFSFFSDIEDRHTFNIDSKNAMDAFAKDKHSIIGLWGGDLVRHGYQVRLLKNGGSENESLFMYQKNLSSYEHKTSTKSLRTRITFVTTIRGEGEKPVDKHYKVVVDSPLINKYSQIYEDVVEVNDQDVADEATLLKYGKQYFRTTLCDMLEDSIEIDVVGQSDVPVQMYDVVSVYHEQFDLDVRKKITKYNYSPMAKKLKSIGFGDFKSGLANAIGNAVSDAIKNETQHLQGQFATQLAKEIKNADLDFDRKKEELVNQFTDGLNAAKAKAEEVKKSLTETIDQRFRDFDSAGLREARQKADEALSKVGANTLLAQEAKEISEQVRQQLDNKVGLVDFQRVKETNQLYERIIGRKENDISNKVSRLVMSDQIFQTEVGNYVINDNNLVVNSETLDKNTISTLKKGVSIVNNNGVFTIDINGLTNSYWGGFTLPIYVPKILKGEVYTLGFKYRIMRQLDHDFRVAIKNHRKNKSILEKTVENANSLVLREWQEFQGTFTMTEDFEFGTGAHYPLFFYLVKNGHVEIKEPMLVRGYKTGSFKPSQFDAAYRGIESTRTQVTQLAGSWAIQNLTSAGSIISQINATNNQILIEAEKIRLKGKTLLDELTAIDGYFKRLFVGEGNFAKLNAEIIGSRTIAADKLIMDQAMARMFVSSDIFTDTLAAKEAFINKLRSVVVSATLLEGFKGRIGGFQIGTHDKDPKTYWLTGQNQFFVGMSNGAGSWGKTALWVNWGTTWDAPGNHAWFVKESGEMYCYNQAHFWNTPIIHGNLKVSGNIYYITDQDTGVGGYWIHSPSYKRIQEHAGYAYLYHFDDSYSWVALNKDISDRRYKSNIEDSTVSGLDVIEKLKTYSYRKEYDGKIEDIACGIMAQDVQKYAPEAFYENPDGAYSYRTFELVPYLIKAIQELNQKIHKLEKKHDRTGQTNQQPDN